MSKQRVLVVDDDQDSAELLALVLEGRGHRARVAYDFEQGLHVAREFKPDVAVIDVMLRLESGYLLARAMKDEPALAHCRLIALTGFPQDRHREASALAGFSSHFIKPCDPKQLLAAVEGEEATSYSHDTDPGE